jgi:transposase
MAQRARRGKLPLSTFVSQPGRASVDSDLRLLASLEAEIAQQEQELATAAYEEPRVKLLMTLPGVSLTVAQTLWAVLGEVDRFRDADHAAILPAGRKCGFRDAPQVIC